MKLCSPGPLWQGANVRARAEKRSGGAVAAFPPAQQFSTCLDGVAYLAKLFDTMLPALAKLITSPAGTPGEARLAFTSQPARQGRLDAAPFVLLPVA